MRYSLLTWDGHHMKHLKDRSHNAKNRRSGEISSCIFEIYNNYVGPHRFYIYNITTDMAMAKKIPCTSKRHWILHWKCMFNCCDK